jgi:hypothetical protein
LLIQLISIIMPKKQTHSLLTVDTSLNQYPPGLDQDNPSDNTTWRRDLSNKRAEGQASSIYHTNPDSSTAFPSSSRQSQQQTHNPQQQYLSPLAFPDDIPRLHSTRPRISSRSSSYSNLTYPSAASTVTDLTEPVSYTPTYAIDFSRRYSLSAMTNNLSAASPSQSQSHFSESGYDSAASNPNAHPHPRRGRRDGRPARGEGLANLSEMEEDQMRAGFDPSKAGRISHTTGIRIGNNLNIPLSRSNSKTTTGSRVKADKMLGLSANTTLVSAYICSGLGMVRLRSRLKSRTSTPPCTTSQSHALACSYRHD